MREWDWITKKCLHNMNYQKEEMESKNIDHLGIIAGIIDEIGIVEKINGIFPIDSREKVNYWEVIKAIILNGLGFVSRPILVKAFINKDIKGSDIKGYSYLEEQVSYGGIEQRWLLVESAERKKSDLNKLDKKIQEELLKANKQVAKLEQEEFANKSLAELKIKEIIAKLKYHQISEWEIT